MNWVTGCLLTDSVVDPCGCPVSGQAESTPVATISSVAAFGTSDNRNGKARKLQLGFSVRCATRNSPCSGESIRTSVPSKEGVLEASSSFEGGAGAHPTTESRSTLKSVRVAYRWVIMALSSRLLS